MLGPKMIEEAEATGRVAEVYARSRRLSASISYPTCTKQIYIIGVPPPEKVGGTLKSALAHREFAREGGRIEYITYFPRTDIRLLGGETRLWRSPSGRARSSAESSASPFHGSVLNRRGAKDRE